MERSTRAALENVQERLESLGYPLGSVEMELLDAHGALIEEWNPICSLVSQGDLNQLWERHVLDSLRVACCIATLKTGSWALLDVGSGGGYPAVVVKSVLPDLPLTMVERSEKKVGFLRRVMGTLGLKGVDIVCGEFPRAASGLSASILTARAVEDPRRIAKSIAAWLQPNSVFVCQTPDVAALFKATFHVEHVEKRFHVEQCIEPHSSLVAERGPIHLVRLAQDRP